MRSDPTREARRLNAGRASLDDGFMGEDPHPDGRQAQFMMRRTDTTRSRQAAHAHGLARAFRRVSLNPWVMGVVLIGALALGIGMLEPILAEARARHGGVWFRATCQIEGYRYAVESHYVGR
jgi:hypothetical protein